MMMNCNGKIWPLFNTCSFNVIVFGNYGKGRVNIKAEYSKDVNAWKINSMDLIQAQKGSKEL